MDVRFNRNPNNAFRNSSSPLYKSTLICNERLTLSFLKKPVVVMKQSWAVGFAILEISKLVMGNLYYNFLLPTIGRPALPIIMSDTDSFLMRVDGFKCEDEIVTELGRIMDTSNYPPEHPLHSERNKRVPGFLKNELPTQRIAEAVALRAKTNSLSLLSLVDETDVAAATKNTAKGVAKNVKKNIPFTAYKACLAQFRNFEVDQYSIQSKNHVNRLLKSRKVAFSSFDDKRYQLCAVHSVPYGSIHAVLPCRFCQSPDLYRP